MPNDELLDKIKQLDIIILAQKLGIGVTKYKQKIKCIAHNDHNPSMSFYIKDGLGKWKCHSCGAGGTTIDLIKEYQKCTFSDAIQWAKKEYFINSISRRKVLKPSHKKEIKQPICKPKIPDNFKTVIYKWIIDNTILDKNAEKFLFEERKFKTEIISELKIRSIPNYAEFHSNAEIKWGNEVLIKYGIPYIVENTAWNRNPIIFPYYDLNGEIINIQARALYPQNNTERFANFRGNETYLFNAQILDKLKDGDKVYIFEGVTDCIAALSYGYNAIAVPGATNYKSEYNELLRMYQLFVYPDNDRAGNGLYERLKKEFGNYCIAVTKKNIPVQYKDFSDYYKTVLWKKK